MKSNLNSFRLIYVLLLVIGGLLLAQDDKAAYDAARGIDDPKEKITALKSFVKDHPESGNVYRAYRLMYRAYIQLSDESGAVNAVAKYLETAPEGRRGSAYNEVAWNLAESGLGLDAANKYADMAVEWAKSLNRPRTLKNILDTQAYARFQGGDAAAAVPLQLQAMEGNENSPDMLGRLAIYYAGVENYEDALKSVARAALLGGEGEDVENLKRWAKTAAGDKDPMVLITDYARTAVKEYLGEVPTENHRQRSNAAVFLAKLNVDTDKADKWTREAVASIDAETAVTEMVNYNSALATTAFYRGDYPAVIETAAQVSDFVEPWKTEFWHVLGQAFEKQGQTEEALNAYIQGLLVIKPDEVKDAFYALHKKAYGSADGADEKIAATAKKLTNFAPGEYSGGNHNNGRVVLAEMFTGAECNPCVSANYAYQALGDYYPRSKVAILKYHLHIPGADPMTNTSTEARYAYYGQNFGTPTAFINGEKVGGGGPRVVTKNRYVTYERIIEKYLANQAPLTLKATTDRTKNQVSVEVEIETASADAFNGITPIFNAALVERDIAYEGGNGVPHHGFVVRKLLAGGEGTLLEMNGNAFTLNEVIDLSAVESELAAYLDEYAKRPNTRLGSSGWRQRLDKMNHDNLAVIVWVQDKESKTVLQAYYADVPAASAAR